MLVFAIEIQTDLDEQFNWKQPTLDWNILE